MKINELKVQFNQRITDVITIIAINIGTVNLARRGIMHLDDTTCPLCSDEPETSCHIFLHCRYAAAVWYAINRWLGVMVVLPSDPMMSYCVLVGMGGNKKIRRGFAIVWLAYIWVIWRVRNDRVFNNLAGNIDDTVDKIQRTSWLWYLNKTAKSSSSLVYCMSGFGTRENV
jgi:hypothetical protein